MRHRNGTRSAVWKLALCAVMTVSVLCGCAQHSAPVSGQEMPAQPANSASAAQTEQQTAQNRTTLRIFSELNSKTANTCTSYDEVLGMQVLEEATGVDILWEHPPIGQEQEQFNLMVASQSLPDMIYWNWMSSYAGGPEKAILDNVIVKLNDYLPQTPNIAALYEQYPELKKQAMTDEGTLYMFPFIRGLCLNPQDEIHNYFVGPAYRKDWADALGIDEPRTIDELYQMLTAFKNSDPQRIAYSATQKSTDSTGIYSMCAAFGVLHNFYMEDGVINHGLLSPKFKSFVETMAQWYAEGLIDPDFLANDSNSFKAKVTNGEVGFYIGSQGGNWVSFSKVLETTVPEAKLAVMHWPAGQDGVAYTAQNAVNHIVSGPGVAITTKNTDLEASLRYLDYGYGQEGIALLNYGIEGVTYQVKDGEITFTDAIKQETDEKGTDFVLGQYAFGGISSWSTLQTVPLMKLTRTYPGQYESVFTWGDCSNALIVPPVTPTTDEATQIANIINQVTTYRDEMIGKIIMGQVPMSEYDAIVEAAKGMGLEQAVAIENAALVRYQNR